MARKKLTEKLKAEIKKNHRKLKKADFSGEALAYLNRVRAGHKAAKTRKRNAGEKKPSKDKSKGKRVEKIDQSIKIGKKTIKPGSQSYELIKEAAKSKKQSVKKFVSENKEAIEALLDNYLIYGRKEIDDLIEEVKELPSNKKIFIPIKGKIRSKARAIFILHQIKKTLLNLADVYEVIFIEYAYDLNGNMYIDVPIPSEYGSIEDGDELLDFIDENYSNITYIRND